MRAPTGLRSSYIAGLDAGTSKVVASVAEVDPAGDLAVKAVALTETQGVRRGVIVDLPQASASIARTLAEAELAAGLRIDAVHLALSPSHATGFNSRGIVAIAREDRVITTVDVARAVDAATPVDVPSGRAIIHVLPQDFVVDDQEGVTAPVGMCGARLEANVYVVTANLSTAQNVIDAVNAAGVAVREIVLDAVAAGAAVLTEDEKMLGTAVVDIGAGTTSYAIYERGSLSCTGVMPLGGAHLTNAVAVGLRTPLTAAERLKRKSGWALATAADDLETIEVESLGRRPPRRLRQRLLSEILEAQAADLFQRLGEQIRERGFANGLAAGVVLTGGGSILGGITRVAERVLAMPVRRGAPAGVVGLIDHVGAPALATAVGLLVHAHRHQVATPLGQARGPLGRMFRDLLGTGRPTRRAS
jgi:cell division protein FtsA